MDINIAIKESFLMLGKLGSTSLEGDWISNLWSDANSHFNEVYQYAKKDETGRVLGIWGAMSNMANTYEPWENNFTKGLYLAGVEVEDGTKAIPEWTLWKIPSFKYLYVKVENNYEEVFRKVILEYLPNQNLSLVGAVQEYYCPEESMQLYLFFPIEKL